MMIYFRHEKLIKCGVDGAVLIEAAEDYCKNLSGLGQKFSIVGLDEIVDGTALDDDIVNILIDISSNALFQPVNSSDLRVENDVEVVRGFPNVWCFWFC